MGNSHKGKEGGKGAKNGGGKGYKGYQNQLPNKSQWNQSYPFASVPTKGQWGNWYSEIKGKGNGKINQFSDHSQAPSLLQQLTMYACEEKWPELPKGKGNGVAKQACQPKPQLLSQMHSRY